MLSIHCNYVFKGKNLLLLRSRIIWPQRVINLILQKNYGFIHTNSLISRLNILPSAIPFYFLIFKINWKKRYLQSVSLILQFLIDRLIHTFYIFQQYQSQKEGSWCEVLNVRIMWSYIKFKLTEGFRLSLFFLKIL